LSFILFCNWFVFVIYFNVWTGVFLGGHTFTWFCCFNPIISSLLLKLQYQFQAIVEDFNTCFCLWLCDTSLQLSFLIDKSGNALRTPEQKSSWWLGNSKQVH
jgi:hypothetical protein